MGPFGFFLLGWLMASTSIHVPSPNYTRQTARYCHKEEEWQPYIVTSTGKKIPKGIIK